MGSGRGVRVLLVSGMVAVLVLLGAGTAAAHAVLLGAGPAAGTTVPTPPARITLSFSEVVDVGADPLAVTGPDGRPVALRDVGRDPADATQLVGTPPAGGPTGTYTVVWRVVSLDGHPIHGSYRFAVGMPDGALTGTESDTVAATGPTVLGGTGRALATTGVLALLGLAAFGALVLGPVRRRMPGPQLGLLPEHGARLRGPMLGSAVIALVGTALVLADTAAGTSGLAVADVLLRPGLLIAQVTGTGSGTLLGLRLAALAGLLVLLARRPAGTRHAVVAAACLAVLPTFSLSSHAVSVRADRAVAVALDGLHLAASGVWAGGLLALALLGRSVAARTRAPGVGADAVGALTARFSTVAQVCMLLVLATGAYAVLIRVTALSDLAATSWGVALTVKIALWLTLLVLAGANAVTLLPRISTRIGQASRRAAAAGELASSVRVELALGAALLAVAAVLAATSPPAEARQLAAADVVAVVGAPASFVATQGDFTVEVGVRHQTAPVAGTVLRVGLSRQGTPIGASAAGIEVTAPDGIARRVPVHEVAEGGWESDPLALARGSYQLTGRFTRSAGPLVVPVPITVPG